jgi:hypothetical protein
MWVKECKSDPVICKCHVEVKYGLVPFELDVDYFCEHMVDYDEVDICFLSYELYCCIRPYLLFVLCR